jgi:S-adenosyl methyltransferase
VTEEQPGQGPRFDTSVASIARIYDYWLGGKDNFKVDREAAEEMIQAFPGIVAGVRMNRAFLGRAIHCLSADAGIRQFLDIGTGLPSADNTHEVAQRAAPDSRIVYVDNHPTAQPPRGHALLRGPGDGRAGARATAPVAARSRGGHREEPGRLRSRRAQALTGRLPA